MLRSMGALGMLCVLVAGCVNPQTRMQMAEETEKERDLGVLTVGDVTDVSNVGSMKVQSVGLVTGLAGTGHCPTGYYRTLLEQYLLKSVGPRNGEIADHQPDVKIRKVLDDPNNALVIVEGYIPAGARRGDRFDVEVHLPPGSKTSSLAGGYLELSLLRVYEAAANLSNKRGGDSTLLASQVFAQAKGPLMVGFGNHSDIHELKHARVWRGGISRTDRPYAFVMKTTEKTVRASNLVAERINYMYQEDPHSRAMQSEQQKYLTLVGNVTDQLNLKSNAGGLIQSEMAKALSKESINVRVPFIYRFNHERYVRVARFTPLSETDQNLQRYQQRLKRMLHDPLDTTRAALRLEAMGRDTIPILKEGLESEHTLVQFCSAEVLAYLGSTYGVDTLTQIAHEHPLFAFHATLALANLGETVCRDKLGDLLRSQEPATRAAAFHAMTLIDEEEPRLGGTNLKDTFWLYRLPQSPAPLVYFSSSKRAQVLLFGRNIELARDTRMFVSKDFTVVTNKDDDQCVVKRISTRGEQKRACSHRLDEILVALADLDATYPDIVDFLRKAHDYRKVNCPVVHWTSPEVSFETLIEAGQGLK